VAWQQLRLRFSAVPRPAKQRVKSGCGSAVRSQAEVHRWLPQFFDFHPQSPAVQPPPGSHGDDDCHEQQVAYGEFHGSFAVYGEARRVVGERLDSRQTVRAIMPKRNEPSTVEIVRAGKSRRYKSHQLGGPSQEARILGLKSKPPSAPTNAAPKVMRGHLEKYARNQQIVSAGTNRAACKRDHTENCGKETTTPSTAHSTVRLINSRFRVKVRCMTVFYRLGRGWRISWIEQSTCRGGCRGRFRQRYVDPQSFPGAVSRTTI
jgi:hypothetical protein